MAVIFDPSNKSTHITLSNGNLTATYDNTLTAGSVRANTFKSSGKWYAEFTVTAGGGSNNQVGIETSAHSLDQPPGGDPGGSGRGFGYNSVAGKSESNQILSNYGASWTTGNVLSVLYDLDGGTVTFWKNGATQGTAFSGVSGTYAFAVGMSAGVGALTANFGASAFTFAPPAGFSGQDAQIHTGVGSAIGVSVVAGSSAPVANGIASADGAGAALAVSVPVHAGTAEAAGSTGIFCVGVVVTIDTVDAQVPAPILDVQIATGTISTFMHAAPAPSMDLEIPTSELITMVLRAPLPLLVATEISSAIITAPLAAPAPIIGATLLSGNVIQMSLQAAAPIMAVVGYPAFAITFVGIAPAPRLSIVLASPPLAAYRTWVLNTRKEVLTEYNNFAFNSFALFNGQVLAAGATGIVILGSQGTDDSAAILARARTGKESFNSSRVKRVPRLYIGHESSGDLIFRAITTEGGSRAYALDWNHVRGVQRRRVPIGKGPKSRYWQFEIENVAGADFGVDNLLVYPTTLHRRVI